MKILVTGGAGYIGSETVWELLSQNHSIVVLDSLEYGSLERLEAMGIADKLVQGSITDPQVLDYIFTAHQIEAVIHFAALKNGSESVTQPARYFSTNVGGTFTLLDAMVKHGVKYFIFSSSGGIYGTPTEIPVTENNNPLKPQTPYGESKLIIEKALPWYDKVYGLKSVCLRYFNAAGASPTGHLGEDWNLQSSLVSLALKAALGVTDVFTIYGNDYPTRDGTCIRDFVHVADLATAHVSALQYLVRTGQSSTYNLGTGQGFSVREVVNTVKRISGVDFPVRELPGRPGDPVAIWANCRKATRELGWQPLYNLEDMVRSAYYWHKSRMLSSFAA